MSISRTWLAGFAVAAACLTSGCCMCSAPYDYCGPTYTGCDEVPCLIDERVGSAFGGWYDAQQAGYEEEIPGDPTGGSAEPLPQPSPKSGQPNDYYEQDTLPEPPPRMTRGSYSRSNAPYVGRTSRGRSNGQNFRIMDLF